VRTIKRSDRPPLLLPQQVQAILDGCAVCDRQAGEWQGNLRDRFLFALLAETGMRLAEALGMRVNEFVMGRGGTPYVQVVPREDNPNGARVKMLRPRRIYVGADLERLNADYLTHLACRAESASRSAPMSCCSATSIGHHCSQHFGKGLCGTRSQRSNAAASAPPTGLRTGFGTATPRHC
jgi:integrase